MVCFFMVGYFCGVKLLLDNSVLANNKSVIE